MEPTVWLFLAHFVPYWTCVVLFDAKTDAHFTHAAWSSLRNQVFITLPVAHLVCMYYPYQGKDVLSLHLSFVFLPLIIVIADWYFYCVHRLLHTKLFWPYHRAHHRGNISVVRSLDADISEHIYANIGMATVGIAGLYVFFGLVLDFYFLVFWVAFATVNTCISHSNLRIPFDKGVHLVHHQTMNKNYGVGLCVADKIFGSFQRPLK